MLFISSLTAGCAPRMLPQQTEIQDSPFIYLITFVPEHDDQSKVHGGNCVHEVNTSSSRTVLYFRLALFLKAAMSPEVEAS